MCDQQRESVDERDPLLNGLAHLFSKNASKKVDFDNVQQLLNTKAQPYKRNEILEQALFEQFRCLGDVEEGQLVASDVQGRLGKLVTD